MNGNRLAGALLVTLVIASGCQSQVAYSVTAPELFAEYSANERATETKYDRKWIKVSGEVDFVEIIPGLAGGPNVEFASRGSGNVKCVFDHKKDVNSFNQRSTAVIIGKWDGVIHDQGKDFIVLRQCTCVKSVD